MLDTDLPPRNHNNPPDPMEIIQAEYDHVFAEVENWLDGMRAENDRQAVAVRTLIDGVKEAEKAAKAAKEDEYRPHKAACDAVVARWKPFLDDLDKQKKGLLAVVNDYEVAKRRAEEAAERRARAEAEAARRAAEEAARQANVADIEAQRAAMQAQRDAEEAQRRLVEASRSKTTGLRTFTVTEVLNMTEWARVAWADHRDEMESFLTDLANRYRPHIPGVVETRKERRAV